MQLPKKTIVVTNIGGECFRDVEDVLEAWNGGAVFECFMGDIAYSNAALAEYDFICFSMNVPPIQRVYRLVPRKSSVVDGFGLYTAGDETVFSHYHNSTKAQADKHARATGHTDEYWYGCDECKFLVMANKRDLNIECPNCCDRMLKRDTD